MLELGGAGAGVMLLVLIGTVLQRAGGDRAIVGRLLVGTAGVVVGSAVAAVLAFAFWPGACLVVLCPDCYRPPASSELWHAGAAYFGTLGIIVGFMPGRFFRAGFAGGVLAVLTMSLDDWTAGGGWAVTLVGFAVCALAWSLRAALARLLDTGPASRPAPVADDLWDGGRWRSGLTAPSSREGRPTIEGSSRAQGHQPRRAPGPEATRCR
jgi:hypothetical protein